MRVQDNQPVRVRILLASILLTACSPSVAGVTPVPKDLRPYLTMTPSSTDVVPAGAPGATEIPLASPTPFEYTVGSGDTLSQIAQKFNVSLDELMAANPDIDPNAMSVGSMLKIPSSPQNLTGDATPTPVPLPVQQIACHPTSDRAMWCFALIHNDSSRSIEDVTARIALLGPDGQAITSQTALLPLDILPPGQSLPLSAFFAPDVPLDVKPQLQIITAIELLPGDPRYLPAAIENTLVSIDWSGLYAQVRGEVALPSGSKGASQVWVAGVAYDGAGNVVGVRRWESSADLAAGQSLPFAFTLSSVAGKIERVGFSVEARP